MTTKFSSESDLRIQTDQMAHILKRAERGYFPNVKFKKKFEAARAKGTIEVGIVMDDKIIKLSLPWREIRETTKEGLSEYILRLMQEKRDDA